MLLTSLLVLIAVLSIAFGHKSSSCRFALDFTCKDFKNPSVVREYLHHVMKWESNFAQPGVAYDAQSGYTYDGHPINYQTGELFGEPHLFSAPSKESIHLALLALAVDGNEYALEFAGGFDNAIKTLELKAKGYLQYNEALPGYGCFTPWVGFDAKKGTFSPLESWSVPYYKVPGLDNGEWFWAIYATAFALEKLGPRHADLAAKYRSLVNCQKEYAQTVFYRGNGDVSATVYILNGTATPFPENYRHCDGYLNDPYEGETLTVLLDLFGKWKNEEERNQLWVKKQNLFEAVNYTFSSSVSEAKTAITNKNKIITVQKGWWFSTHEQWKTLLLPYLTSDLPLVRKVFRNCEKARVWDAVINHQPGLLASINDVTDGSQDIPDYASACGIASLAYEKIDRRDLITPYGSFGLFLHDTATGFCWYNNMLRGSRMQSFYGSTEAINVNGTEISPLTTWDSKITTVLAMLGGIGPLVEQALKADKVTFNQQNAYERFVDIINREYHRVFGNEDQVLGDDVEFGMPHDVIPSVLDDWKLSCAL